MPHDPEEQPRNGVSRRQFLKGAGVVGAGATLATELLEPEAAEAAPHTQVQGKIFKAGTHKITLNVNGAPVTLEVEPRTTLLNALRNHAEPAITGTKLVCDQGACGACTVLVEGESAYGCLQLALDMVGKEITTVEGLTKPDGTLHAIQQAFVEHDALMCGFCTPGFLVSLAGLLKKTPNPTEDDVKQACAGNYCRCGTYPRIFEAAQSAAKKLRGGV
jgi:aerobic-type carbon monoxide dehydrogenase small subunit (CoxS/CutS family)